MRNSWSLLKTVISIFTFAMLVFSRLAVVDAAAFHSPADASGAHAVSDEKTKDKKNYRENELLVKFKPGLTDSERKQVHGKLGSSVFKGFKGLRIDRVKLAPGLSVEEAIRLYSKSPRVEYAEPDFVLEAYSVPDDPRFNELWGFNNTGQTGGTTGADIKAPDAWNITTGDSSVVVAVIDTGIDYTHEDLSPNVWSNPGEIPGNGVDDDGNGYVDDIYGLDTYNNDSNPFDDHGHGTHVSGTIGAVGNNGTGVAGVNWNVKILGCKFLGSEGSGFTSDAVECLEYIRNLKNSGVNIIATNNSWGGGYSQALYDAINAQREILFIAAAGNDSADTDQSPVYPSAYYLPNVISVAATEHSDNKASFSNYGKRTVHVGAPGENVLSTLPAQNKWNLTGGYGFLSGTSMAAPHATGTVALIKSQDTNRDWRQIKNLILAGGDNIPAMEWATISGRRLDAYNTLTCVDRPVFSALKYPSSVQAGQTVTLSALSINCNAPVEPVTVTASSGESVNLYDDGSGQDMAAGDGIFTVQWTPSMNAANILFSSPAGTENITDLSVTTTSLPVGLLSFSYSGPLTAMGGLPPYSWSIVSGSLAPGLSIDSSTGTISGTPTSAGTFTFAVQVTDAASSTAAKMFSIVINPVIYTITTSAGEGGAISPGGTIGVYPGDSQTFQIFPSSGYAIADVMVDGVSIGTVSNYTFTNVMADHTISATFAKLYNMSAAATVGGTISPSGYFTVIAGQSVTFDMVPSYGYFLKQVYVDNIPVGAVSSYTFNNIQAPHSILASFSKPTIQVSPPENGTISPSGFVEVDYGGSQTFTITPNAGYHISNVMVDGVYVGAVNSYTFTNVTSNHTIYAIFLINTYTITTSATVNGTISPSGTVLVNYGGSKMYTFTPNVGYHMADVLVDGVSVGAVSSYTFTNVTANHTVSATFAINTYTITASAEAGGTISPSGAITVNHGFNKTFSITPIIGYSIADVLVDGVSVGAVGSYTFTSVTANHTVSATFAINTYTITASSGAGGMISPLGAVTVNYGGSQTFSITPSAGYHAADVLVDGVSVGAVSSYTFTNITANHTISAGFAINSYSITATAGANGSISGPATANYGDNATYTITPDVGYHVADVLVDGVSVGAVTTYTFTNVTVNHTISASFAAVADLIATSVTGPNSATRGKSISVSSMIKNQGIGTAGPSTVTFYLSLDSSISTSDTLLGSKAVTSLTSGSTATVSASFTVPSGMPTGKYYVGVIVDSGSAVVESNESNNSTASSRTTTIR